MLRRYLSDIGEIQHAYSMDSYGPRSHASLQWEIIFKTLSCPAFLQDIHRVNWLGHKILVKHVLNRHQQPCLLCGDPQHLAKQCQLTEIEMKTKQCLTVNDKQLQALKVPPRTFLSAAEVLEAFLNIGERRAKPAVDTSANPVAPIVPSDQSNPITPKTVEDPPSVPAVTTENPPALKAKEMQGRWQTADEGLKPGQNTRAYQQPAAQSVGPTATKVKSAEPKVTVSKNDEQQGQGKKKTSRKLNSR